MPTTATFTWDSDRNLWTLRVEKSSRWSEINEYLSSIPGVIGLGPDYGWLRTVPSNAVAIVADALGAFSLNVTLPSLGVSLADVMSAAATPAYILPHQTAALHYLQSSEYGGRYLLAHGMGAGKTLTALIAAEHWGHPVLVVAPASVREAKTWEIENWKTDVKTGLPQPWHDGKPFVNQMTVLSYQELVKACKTGVDFSAELVRFFDDGVGPGPCTIIVDEIHLAKNPQTATAKAVRTAIEANAVGGGHAIGLSGTVMGNSPAEIFTVCELMWPGSFGGHRHFYRFTARHCGSYQKDVTAKGGTGETKKVWYQPRLDEVSTDPTERRKLLHLDELASRFRQLAHVVTEAELRRSQKLPPLTVRKASHSGTPEQRRKLAFLEHSLVYSGDQRMRGEFYDLAVAIKAGPVAASFATYFAGEYWSIILCWRHTAVDALQAALIDAGYPEDKIIRLDKLTAARRAGTLAGIRQDSDGGGVILCTIDAIREGIDLTFCRQVDYVELPFVPGRMAQGIKRFHRFGQQDTVNVTIHAVEGSLDDDIAELLKAKIRSIDDVTAGDNEVADVTQGSIFDALDDESDVLLRLLDRLTGPGMEAVE